MKTYFDCWLGVATALFSQALAGEPELSESLPKPQGAGAFGWAATLSGEAEGRFSVLLDGALLQTSLVGEGMDQKAGWSELLHEVADAAAGDLLARTGRKCQVVKFEEIAEEGQVSHAFQLRSGERVWTILVRDEVKMPEVPADSPNDEMSGATAAPNAVIQGQAEQEQGGATALSPDSSCCWMWSWKLHCASARARCRWARFWIWVQGTSSSLTGMSPILWT